MRTSRTTRSRLPLVAVATAAALLGVGGCGSEDSGPLGDVLKAPSTSAPQPTGGSTGGPTRSGSPAPTSSKRQLDLVPTQEQLDGAVLTTADLPAGSSVEALPTGGAEPVAEKAACRPMMDLVTINAGTVKPHAHKSITYSLASASKGTNAAVIASFAPGQAQRILSDGIAAIDACSSFTGAKDGVTVTYTVSSRSDPHLGDESVSLRLDTAVGGQSIPSGYTIVRVGNVVTEFVYVEVSSRAFALPDQSVVRKQVDKLKAIR
ncbi:hypothetical protein [Streptomyces sp. SID3343]|uniref:hypothetical protein n=1 Tax=Streptomyces sp. SID3343 TaxID=2690260 RepID=UPI00136D9A17|nr:hypothetical protein [Streptomyces sp. SID3343]MYW05720.1 hypothetical protein [Streptomyces sp. SID3343]